MFFQPREVYLTAVIQRNDGRADWEIIFIRTVREFKNSFVSFR